MAEKDLFTWLRHIQLSSYCHDHYPGITDGRGNLACPCGWVERPSRRATYQTDDVALTVGMTLGQLIQQRIDKDQQGPWVPASGGTEVPFPTRTGRRLLYCWQSTTGRHAYLDCDTDLILSDEDAQLALGNL